MRPITLKDLRAKNIIPFHFVVNEPFIKDFLKSFGKDNDNDKDNVKDKDNSKDKDNGKDNGKDKGNGKDNDKDKENENSVKKAVLTFSFCGEDIQEENPTELNLSLSRINTCVNDGQFPNEKYSGIIGAVTRKNFVSSQSGADFMAIKELGLRVDDNFGNDKENFCLSGNFGIGNVIMNEDSAIYLSHLEKDYFRKKRVDRATKVIRKWNKKESGWGNCCCEGRK